MRLLGAGFVVGLVVVCVFSPAIHYGFLGYDDQGVEENQEIKTLDFHLLQWAFTSFPDGNWIPITWISYAVDRHFFGEGAAGHHLINVLLHALNAFLVLLLTHRVVTRYFETHPPPDDLPPSEAPLVSGRDTLHVAILTALIFGLHPLRAQSVVWIFERKDVLYGFFFLLSLLFYLLYIEPGRQRRLLSYGISIVAFTLSAMAKPMAVTLPLIFMVLDTVIRQQTAGTNPRRFPRIFLLEKSPFLLVSVGISVLTVIGQESIKSLLPVARYSISARIMNSVYSLWFYAFKTLLPAGLSPFYPSHAYASESSIRVTMYAVVILGVSTGCVAAARRGRVYWAAAWGYYVICLLPVMGLVKVGAEGVASRFSYLSTLSIILLASAGLVRLLRLAANRLAVPGMKETLLRAVATALITLILAVACSRQIRVWSDIVLLWSRAIDVLGEDSAIPHAARGFAWIDRNSLRQAFEDCDRAVSIDPGCTECLMCRAEVFEKTGNVAGAVGDYGQVLRLNPFHINALNNRGVLYERLGDPKRAAEDFRRRDYLSGRGLNF